MQVSQVVALGALAEGRQWVMQRVASLEGAAPHTQAIMLLKFTAMGPATLSFLAVTQCSALTANVIMGDCAGRTAGKRLGNM